MEEKDTIRDIIARLKLSPRSFYAFESIALLLLEEYLKESKKPLETKPEVASSIETFKFRPDAVAPKGTDDLPGPTLVEIKFPRRTRLPLETFDRVAMLAKRTRCKSVLLILGNDLQNDYRERIQNYWTEGSPSTPLEIWDIEKLEALLSKHREKVSPILSNIAEFRLRSVVEKPSIDWRQEREDRLHNLSVEFGDGNFSLVLGAGVSIDSGLPDWSSLLDSLFVRLLTRDLANESDIRDSEIDSIVKRLKDVDDPSPLLTARYLRKGLNNAPTDKSDSFYTIVSDELYRRGKRRSRVDTWIKALAKMTRPRRTGAKIKAVVTYNFDDLLEKELRSTGDLFRSIFREGDIPTSDELPIYHVHGFLPENTVANGGRTKITN